MEQYSIWCHKDMGYCACVRASFGWQQCSKYYTSIPRLIHYWAKPLGLECVYPFSQYNS